MMMTKTMELDMNDDENSVGDDENENCAIDDDNEIGFSGITCHGNGGTCVHPAFSFSWDISVFSLSRLFCFR